MNNNWRKNIILFLSSQTIPLFVFCGIFFFLAALVSFLTPLQVTRTFGDDVWRLAAIEISFPIGMMAGGIIMASWGGFKNKIHTMTLSSVAIGVFTLALDWFLYSGYTCFHGLSWAGYANVQYTSNSFITAEGRGRFSRQGIWCFRDDIKRHDAFRNACVWSIG